MTPEACLATIASAATAPAARDADGIWKEGALVGEVHPVQTERHRECEDAERHRRHERALRDATGETSQRRHDASIAPHASEAPGISYNVHVGPDHAARSRSLVARGASTNSNPQRVPSSYHVAHERPPHVRSHTGDDGRSMPSG